VKPRPDSTSAAIDPPPAWFEHLATVFPTLTSSPFSRSTGIADRPADRSVRHSAVLVLFGPGASAGPDILLTQRSAGMRSHAGQVAFPGGRIDPGDAGPEAAALREAVEETRLDPAGVQIRGSGPQLYLPPSNFLVTPVIAWWRQPSPVAPGDPAEVRRVVRVPIAELTDPANRFQAEHVSGFVSPGFGVSDLFVWGFTAGVLSWLLSLCGLEQPWDRSRRRPVPEQGSEPATLDAELTEQAELTEHAELTGPNELTEPNEDRDQRVTE
jgi:8-oxo-dGTP pyrophosphatase MutT (NUDIX family)